MDDEWTRATLRSGEPWTPAEEERLRRIYAARRKSVWCGKPRTKPMYAAAAALKRTPCACAGRMAMLRRIDKAVNARGRVPV
jgi:hypothetical protein